MSRMRIVGFGLVVMIVGSACGLSSAGRIPGRPGVEESPTAEPTEVPVLPVSINEGLASLDSYRMTYTNDIYDSRNPRADRDHVRGRQRSECGRQLHPHGDASHGRESDELVSEDVQEQFAIGNQLCQVSGRGSGADDDQRHGPGHVGPDVPGRRLSIR